MIGTNERTDNKSKVKINYEFLAFLGQTVNNSTRDLCVCLCEDGGGDEWRRETQAEKRWDGSRRWPIGEFVFTPKQESLSIIQARYSRSKLFLRVSLWTASLSVCSFSYTWTSGDLHIHHSDTHTHTHRKEFLMMPNNSIPIRIIKYIV